MGASTVLLPLELLAVKLTMVPSGTTLPEQSWTGSVSTRMPFDTCCALIRKLQGSDATSCKTRCAEMSFTDAVSWAMPALFPEPERNQATPKRVGIERENKLALLAVN